MSSLFRSPLLRGMPSSTHETPQPTHRSPDHRSYTTELPGDNLNAGPQIPTTREELNERMQLFMSDKDVEGTPITALEKTNFKYMQAKNCPHLSETPEAEATAVRGMYELMMNNQELVTSPGYQAHLAVQELDRGFHRSVTSRDDNPYGPLTTAATDWVPTPVRAAYSYATSHIPTFKSRLD